MSRQKWIWLIALIVTGVLGVLLGTGAIQIPRLASSSISILDQSENSGARALEDWERISSILQNTTTIVALFLGGAVGYFKFVKGRIYRPRIEPAVSVRVARRNDGIAFLVIHSEVKNVGHSKIALGASSGIDVQLDNGESLPGESGRRLPIQSIRWKKPTSFPVFREHDWIESGETIREEMMLALSGEDLMSVKVALHIAVGAITATAMTIVGLDEAKG